jgi:hypothetical protein
MTNGIERTRFTYTGVGDLASPFFTGQVTLSLDASRGEIVAFTPQLGSDRNRDLRGTFESESDHPQRLSNVRITLPLGQIFAAQLTGLRFRAYHPGTLSVFSTPVSNFLELREMTGISALSLTPESGVFEFEIQSGFTQGTELIFSSHSISVSPPTPVCNG